MITKKLIIIIITVINIGLLSAQKQFETQILPPSFSYPEALFAKSEDERVVKTVAENLNVRDLLETDKWRAGREGTPMPVTRNLPVDFTMTNSGIRYTLPSGEKVWRLNIKGNNATALMLGYKDFYIPKGGQLFIYNKEKTQVLDVYTHETRPDGGVYATGFVGGDEICLEYVESSQSDEQPRIAIDEVGFGYNPSLLGAFISTGANTGECMVNINCQEGDAWQHEKNGVFLSLQKIGSASFICSGTLINNTAEDMSPLLLTAQHCATGSNDMIATADDMNRWMFFFLLERSSCDKASEPTHNYLTMTGCRLLVKTGMAQATDGMLLMLNDPIPPAYNLYYNGWDRRNVASSSGVCIHHPNGDYKMISTYNKAPTSSYFPGEEFIGASNGHWYLGFTQTANGHSITQGGSSGSPLFNENKLVVGTLTGGSSKCNNAMSASGHEYYGKMSYHWNKYTKDSTHMDIWLDPLNLGVESLRGRYARILPAPENLTAVTDWPHILLSWQAPTGESQPVKYNIYRNTSENVIVKILETTSLNYTDENPVAGSNKYSVAAVYEDGSESTFSTVKILFERYKPPTDLEGIRNTQTPAHIDLKWKKPYYEQNVTWSTMELRHFVGLSDNPWFYYGQRWEAAELAPFNNKTISSVHFVPVAGSTYEKILITQNNTTYTQNIDANSLTNLILNEIKLETPFTIDGTSQLIVAVKCRQIDNNAEYYSIACDHGPVVDGKGNILSYDGETWGTIYDPTKPNEFFYNFIISATFTSENGNLTPAATVSSLDASVPVFLPTERRETPYNAVDTRNVNVRAAGISPAAFPEVTHYILTRLGSKIESSLAPSLTSYTDKSSTVYSDYYYELEAMYGELSGGKSNKITVNHVANEPVPLSLSGAEIYPAVFSDFINVSPLIVRIEAVSVTGQTGLVIVKPAAKVDVSSLPAGVWFFRIHRADGSMKTYKGIKN
ncbi:MAG: protease [Tannerella sp.]|jgi:hypothetical protein|nr:protease [Tannerella sp.]